MISPKINFSIEDFTYQKNGNPLRLVVFKIPAAVGQPTCFKQKSWIRVDSHTTDLAPYTEWIRKIYNSRTDWTAQIIEDATIEDLDKDAIQSAREGYGQRFPDFSETLQTWNDATFLDKAGLTIDGKITRTAMLLVGKPEKAYKLGHIAQMDWKCFQDGEIIGQLFTIPFLKTTTELMLKIRNYRIKIYPHNSLIPAEIWKYDIRSILEGLHNCIAHQDYTKDERIIVTEDKEKLTFENAGCFYEGDYEQYILGEKTPKKYRNPFLVKAMLNVKMIDSQGFGIHNMYMRQKERYLPMPDYEGTDESHVIMHLPGSVIDVNYSTMLMENADISLTEAVLLDMVQKGKTLSDNAISILRKKKLIEGRKPKFYIAKTLAQHTDRKVEYSRHKGLISKSCESLLVDSLKDHGELTRQDIDLLLWPVLSDQLNDTQKKAKIGNLLTKLRKKGILSNVTKGNSSVWSIKQ
jgi:ATP-dependent DNA helicase RecG